MSECIDDCRKAWLMIDATHVSVLTYGGAARIQQGNPIAASGRSGNKD
jgi:hypothetical protein